MVSVVYTHDIFSRQTTGGISRYFAELIRGVAAVTPCRVAAGLHRNRHLAEVDGADVRGRYLGGRLAGFASPALRLLNRTRQEFSLPGRSDLVVHQTYFGFAPAATRGKTVVTVYDMMPELFGHASGSRLRLAGVMAAKRLSCRRADRVIAISETTKRDVCEHYGLDEAKVDAIPLGNSLAPFAGGDLSRPVARPYLLYVGTRSGYKNWSTLVTAIGSSPSLRDGFDLVCFGGGPLSDDERELIARSGLAGQVQLAGGDDRSLAAHYRHAAAYVCPSFYEGFGLPCVEAMGFGCPVVCSDRGSLPEVVGRAGVYFDPTDVDSIREAVERTVSDSALVARLKPLMAERERRFRWSDTVAATLESYRAVLGEETVPAVERTRKAA